MYIGYICVDSLRHNENKDVKWLINIDIYFNPKSCNYIKFRFILRLCFDSINDIIYQFGTDSEECAFTGTKVLCSYSFIQSINTRTILFYHLSYIKPQYYIKKILKYYLRGFNILLPPTHVIYVLFIHNVDIIFNVCLL